MLDLTSDQVADAEIVGVSFPSATPQQVQRLAMQRKVLRVDGEPVLATRDGSLFETAATLHRLIAEGGRQRRDLAEWEAATAPAPVDEAPAPPPPAPAAKPEPSAQPESAPRPHLPLAVTARQRKAPRAERWLTAGAERRGRLAQHWSRRGAR